MTIAFSTNSLLALLLACILTLQLIPESQAKVVKYTLKISYFTDYPDGTGVSQILGINGQFPGPTLEANVGDTFEITLINSIQDGQNTSLHWHGIYQKNSQFEDGAAMITSCPLPHGKSMVYRFNATEAGTFWYHSHVNSQYTEGMFGPLIIHGTPEAYIYDGEVTLTLSDWFHQSAHENEEWHLSPSSRGVPPYPNAGLINGMGRYPCEYANRMNRECESSLQYRPVIRLHRDKTYRLRLINAASVSAFNFSIDHHSLNTIEVDGIDVAKPVAADIVPITAGQRYSFLISCNNENGRNKSRYVIRASLRKESLMLIEGININKYPEALMGDLSAVLECVDEDLTKFRNSVEVTREIFTCYDVVPPEEFGMKRSYLNEMELRPLNGIPAPDYFDDEFVLETYFLEDHENIRRGSFNSSFFVLPHDKPLLMKVLDGDIIPQSSFPLEINYGSVVQVVINNSFAGPHPFHLHGHHFWIMGMGDWNEGMYDPSKHNLTVNGVKRDTVTVQEGSWAVIRFIADNPGVWVFHCHIDWHNLSGMALTFVEGADIIRNSTIPPEAARVCKMHDNFKSKV